LAQTVYLTRRACADALDDLPTEAFLLVESGHGTEHVSQAGNEFARRLGRMYGAWAKKREMRVEILEESGPERKPYRVLLSISGYAAYSILAPEDGLHFFEIPRDAGKHFKRLSARVRVVAQPERPADGSAEEILAQARDALESAAPDPPEVVRRYREKPSPLVRDSVRGWRTGLLDRVMAGDFDLFAARERDR
jgi:ATP-dependent Clp protease ATP-binding subunit ClpC